MSRVAEVEVDTVTEHLHDLALVPRRDLVDQPRERERDLGSNLVTGLLGELGVAREVRQGGGLDPAR